MVNIGSKVKNDFLKECLSEVSSKIGKMVPIDDFNKNFCVVCVNHECSRAASGKLKFENRVNNWESIYFTGVSRADNNDPKFEHIRMQKFVTPNSNIYVLDEPNIIVPEPILKPDPVPDPTPKVVTPETPKVLVSPPQPVTQTNTQFNQGAMLTPDKTTVDPGQVFVFDDE